MTLLASPSLPLLRRLMLGAAALCRLTAPAAPAPITLISAFPDIGVLPENTWEAAAWETLTW
jgi:hypothetical protein